MVQLMHSFKGLQPPDKVLALIKSGQVASICLFAYQNVESPAQVRQMTDALRAAAVAGGQPQPIIGIDQEGGQLIAIANGATELPGNMALGATRSPELAEKAGRVLGRELLAMGVNMNFAPTLDVNNNPHNPVIGIRSFGDTPELVAQLGAAMIQGMQAEGVIAAGKHFPGHGDTSTDSHHGAPIVEHSRERLEEIEFKPFQAAIKAGIGAVMTSHIIYTALDKDNPATISLAINKDLLRDQFDYNGLIVTDAMDMHAVARLGHKSSVEAALKAGADIVLLGHIPDQPALMGQTQHLFVAEAVERVNAARNALRDDLPELSVVGCAEHQQIAQEIADRSITVVRDVAERLPLKPESDETIGVIYMRPMDLTPADTSSQVEIRLGEAIRKRHANIVLHEMPYNAEAQDIRAALDAVAELQTVIVATINAEKDAAQAELVRELHRRRQMPIVVSLRTPYDIVAFPQIETYLCAYGVREVTTEAVARVLFGEIQAEGILPCAIPGMMQAV